MNNSYLSLKNVDMNYFGGYVGLINVSFEMQKGQAIAFFGDKFCGKTNLLKVICGLEKPSSGQILFEQNDLDKTMIKDRNLSFSFGVDSLKKNDTVENSVSYSLVLRKLEKDYINNRLDLVLESFGLIDFKYKNIKQLDKPTLCRVLLARLFIRSSNLYLIDNIFEGIDNKERQQLFELLKAFVSSNQLTAIYCSDNIDEVIKFGENIGILKNCRLVDFGSIEMLRHSVKHIQVERVVFNSSHDLNKKFKTTEQCNLDYNFDMPEVGNLIKEDEQYYIVFDDKKVKTVPPIDDVYISRQVMFLSLKNQQNFIKYYYDLASEYRVSQLIKEKV